MAVEALPKTEREQTSNEPKRKRKFAVFASVYAAVIIVLNVAALLSRQLCDFFTDHLFFIAANTTGRISGLFPFSLGEVLISLAIVLLVTTIIICIILIFNHKQDTYKRFAAAWLRVMAVIVLTVALLYTFNCSYLYLSTPMQFAGGTREFDVDEFEAVRNMVVNECNALAPQMEREDDGTMIFTGDSAKAAAEALRGISGDFPRLSGYYPPAKEMWGSYFMYKSDIIGVYFPFSMEANYSSYVSDSFLPHVIAHEYAHLKGYIYENEANFMSFLACINSDDPAVRYSGYLCVLYYIEKDYTSSVPDERAAKQVQLSNLVRFDDYCYDRKTWEYLQERDKEKEQPKIAEAAEKVGDTLTDIYQDALDYTPNYSEVTLLMMQYYTEVGSFAAE